MFQQRRNQVQGAWEQLTGVHVTQHRQEITEIGLSSLLYSRAFSPLDQGFRPMLYETRSAAVYGIDANVVDVEVDISGIKTNDERFTTVGLPDAAVRESRDRVKSALKN
jgi:Subunit ChlI of Mg-chelatase